ncbi:histidine phosphatase family protein [Angustibacter peucedani]
MIGDAGWPAVLTLVRHGESVGNVEARRAALAGLDRLELATRDADTPLSDDGRDQAHAVGLAWVRLPPGEQPDVVLSSPFRRALETAQLAVGASGLDLAIRTDERLRERDLGAFDGLTQQGIERLHPDEAVRRSRTGKVYYQPPGGESWCDVALRVRSAHLTWREELAGRRVAVFTHQAVVMASRMVLEPLSETAVLDVDRRDSLANAASTRYRRDDAGRLALEVYNEAAAAEGEG